MSQVFFAVLESTPAPFNICLPPIKRNLPFHQIASFIMTPPFIVF